MVVDVALVVVECCLLESFHRRQFIPHYDGCDGMYPLDPVDPNSDCTVKWSRHTRCRSGLHWGPIVSRLPRQPQRLQMLTQLANWTLASSRAHACFAVFELEEFSYPRLTSCVEWWVVKCSDAHGRELRKMLCWTRLISEQRCGALQHSCRIYCPHDGYKVKETQMEIQPCKRPGYDSLHKDQERAQIQLTLMNLSRLKDQVSFQHCYCFQ